MLRSLPGNENKIERDISSSTAVPSTEMARAETPKTHVLLQSHDGDAAARSEHPAELRCEPLVATLSNADRIRKFYEHYNPEKLRENGDEFVKSILDHYEGNFDILFDRLREKYGREPS
jgi:hypothetical protein